MRRQFQLPVRTRKPFGRMDWPQVLAACVSLCFLCCSSTNDLQAQPPELTRIFPAGGAPDSTVEITLSGKFPKWPIAIHSTSPDVLFEANSENGKVTAKIAANASPQIVWVRLHEPSGVTQAQRFVIGNGLYKETIESKISEAVEMEPNGLIDQSQAIASLPIMLNGALEKSGDVDLFALQLKKGESIAVNLFAERGLRSAVDASIQILDGKGFVLEQNLDTFGLDPFVFFLPPADGTYHIRVFGFPAQPDSTISFAGNPNWIYRLQITKSSQVSWTSMVPMRTTAGPEFAASIDRAQPTSITVPLSCLGTLSTADQKHFFRFHGKAGTNYRFETESQDFGSIMDPVILIEDASGKLIVNQDDLQEKRDPRLDWRCTADGEFTLVVSDLHKGFGPNCFYRLAVSEQHPSYVVSVATDLIQGTVGKEIEIPITIDRMLDFAGDIRFDLIGAGEIATQNSPVSKKGEDTAKKITLKVTLNQPFQGPVSIRATTDSSEATIAEKTLVHAADDKPLWLSVKAE